MSLKVKRSINDYHDIINCERHISPTRPKMDIKDRSAQFAPFSAVVGHNEAVKETARLTSSRKDLDEMEKTLIDEALRKLDSLLDEKPQVEIVHFVPDLLKEGGNYENTVGYVKKIDVYKKIILMQNGDEIPIAEVIALEFLEKR